ncbi:hypothetical protein QUW02_11065, partial [Bacteroides eggerthii]|nr:hypothetical protein [Bacteroides eggerthii]
MGKIKVFFFLQKCCKTELYFLFLGLSGLLQRFPAENFSGKYLVGKKKVSTFATANEKQTPL